MFRWAFIGTGKIAHSVARKICGRGHNIVSVYSRNFINAQQFADKYGTKANAYDSLMAAVSDPKVDAVYIATTNESHVDIAMAVLAIGKPVLIEKPAAINAHTARQLFDFAKSREVYAAEAMWTWFSPQSQKIKSLVESNAFGSVTDVYISFCMPIIGRKINRVNDINKAGGALLDIGVYPVAAAYHLFGYPERISCKARMQDGVDIEDDLTLSYDGFDVTIELSLKGFKKGAFEKLRLKGKKGSLRANNFHSCQGFNYRITGEAKKRERHGKTMLNQFNMVAAEIGRGKKESDFVPHVSTVAVLQILDECRRQIGLIYPSEQ